MINHQKFAAGRTSQFSAAHEPAPDDAATSVDVLIAENNEINKCYVENVLGELGLTCRTVDNGLAVVEAYKHSQPRIILMDIAMPLSDGVEATKNIRRHEGRNNLPPVPIIALSANAIPGLRERYLDAGMNDYLLKPYSIEQIRDKLEEWILPQTAGEDRPRAQQRADMFAGD
ncbi:MAG: response regulator [Rhodobacteraceae bacterium]|nr:response regulator [Paracoccaceae bacterium]